MQIRERGKSIVFIRAIYSPETQKTNEETIGSIKKSDLILGLNSVKVNKEKISLENFKLTLKENEIIQFDNFLIEKEKEKVENDKKYNENSVLYHLKDIARTINNSDESTFKDKSADIFTALDDITKALRNKKIVRRRPKKVLKK